MATKNTNVEPFQIKNMHNLNWTNKDGSPSIVKASFTLSFLPHKAELRDCLYKVGMNGPWVESKSIACTPWTDRNGKEQRWQQVMNLKTMGELLKQLEKHITGIYNLEGNYDAINGTAEQTTTTATTTVDVVAETVAA